MTHAGRWPALVAFLALPLTAVLVLSNHDPREELRLPDDTHGAFRAEMKTHMVNLKDLTKALAEQDYRQAAEVAEARVDFGHFMWTAMADRGASNTRIARLRAELGESDERGVMGPEDTPAGATQSIPMEFRRLGRNLKEAAQRFALLAQTMETPATSQSSARLNAAYQDLVGACQACHDTYRIESSVH